MTINTINEYTQDKKIYHVVLVKENGSYNIDPVGFVTVEQAEDHVKKHNDMFKGWGYVKAYIREFRTRVHNVNVKEIKI